MYEWLFADRRLPRPRFVSDPVLRGVTVAGKREKDRVMNFFLLIPSVSVTGKKCELKEEEIDPRSSIIFHLSLPLSPSPTLCRYRGRGKKWQRKMEKRVFAYPS